MSIADVAARHHADRIQSTPGVWSVARPPRSGWAWRQWRKERDCRRTLGHCWHAGAGWTEWWCCSCGADTEGTPAQECVVCVATRREQPGPDSVPEPNDLTGPEQVRRAVADSAGWEWCRQHRRARWQGTDPCRHLHPAELRPDDPAWCYTCERMHGPMEWGEGCADEEDLR